ncbi:MULTISPECIES: DUF3106 domain-containing protein [unclassified Polaromonas]|uniref:DUF3106 domain-containing protein n=1 Tax=unclassified Polaromonas TaxID=2638319 RepID=UPI000F095236|nr:MULTISPECIES: DUF3106 domain-containing protein [unclassified Polaromonas]AYQ29345.1 DUF3106 domain-containing protein [Polaromonas sp. SP1]QGJ19539.1 DUF3106 domain-containing protein [Polaromonas sp. Pch-P]
MILQAAVRRTLLPSGHSTQLRLQWLSFGGALLIAALLTLPSFSFAQAVKPAPTASSAPAATKSAASAPAKVMASKPSWAELSPMQQQALKPLASSWNTNISQPQKRKWLEISKNYPSLSPEEQATMHSRMNEWVTLSPQQRAQARLNFARTKELSKQLTPEEKKAKWETYQALSPEEKQKLAAKANPKPLGAATAVKPVAPQKLAPVPPHTVKAASKPAPRIIASQPVAAAAVLPASSAAGGPAATPLR